MINTKFNIGDFVYYDCIVEVEHGAWLNSFRTVAEVRLHKSGVSYSLIECCKLFREDELLTKEEATEAHKRYIKSVLDKKGQELMDLQDYYLQFN